MNYELSNINHQLRIMKYHLSIMFGHVPGPFRDHSGVLSGSFQDHPGVILGSFRDHSEVIPGSFWDHSDHSGVIPGSFVGSFWYHFRIILGSFWHHFGITLGSLWNYFRPLWHQLEIIFVSLQGPGTRT